MNSMGSKNRIIVSEKQISILLIMCMVLRVTADLLKGYPKQSFQISEWLINYQGGFVRRGLPGELIYQISLVTDISPYYIIVSVAVLAYIAMAILLITMVGKSAQSLLIFSPLLLGMPVFSNFWIRKDVMLILLFSICILLLKRKNQYKYLWVNLLGIIAVLSHESFGFWGAGGIFVFLITQIHISTSEIWRTSFSAFLRLIPIWITFLMCIDFNGYNGINDVIHASWNSFYFPFENTTLTPDAIDALGWSLSDGLRYSLSIFTRFTDYIIYVPLAWFINISMAVVIFIHLLIHHNNRIQAIIPILLMQGMLVTPLFVLGFDYGRWVFFWFASTFVLLQNSSVEQFAISSENSFVHSGFYTLSYNLNTKWIYTLVFFFSIPHCCWSILHFIKSTPAFQPILALMRIIDKLNPEPIFNY
jgi:hypothetical protein